MPLLVPYVAFDPGSRRLGAVAAHGTDAGMHVLAAEAIAVDEHDLGAAVERARAFVLAHAARGVVIERGALYMPAGVTPQAAQQIAHHWHVMSRLADGLATMAAGLGLRVRECTRAAWAHRIIPHHSGGITDAMVLAALPRYVVHGMAELRTKDLRDAAGAWLWSMIDPPAIVARRKNPDAKPRIPWFARDGYVVPPELRTLALKIATQARMRRDARLRGRARHDPDGAAAYLARHAQRCTCGPGGGERGRGRHAAWCGRAPPPRVTGPREPSPEALGRAGAALDALFGRARA